MRDSNMKNMKLFIWDFDGTLADSYPYSVACMQRAIGDFGHKVTYAQVMEQMLENIPAALRHFSQLFEIPDLDARFRHYHQLESEDPPALFEGVLPVLDRIEQLGGVNLIFTNRNEAIFPMLEQLGIADRFAEVVTTIHPHFAWKPAPDAIAYLMKTYGGTTENTVMIGDRICDLASGWNAGCKTCHLLTPAVPQYPPCDWRVENFDQLLALLS